jgi:type II secretory pathway pseudopilin PulG
MKRRRPAGFTYVGVLVLVALLGLVLAGAGQAWRHQAQRERETELLFAGTQIRAAIASYLGNSPGSPEYPPSLEALLEDRRLPVVRRHLRRIYADPMTGKADWVLVLAAGRITGVHSRADGVPFRRAGFDAQSADFADAATYRDWRFVVAGGGAIGQGTPGAAGSPAPAVYAGAPGAGGSSAPALDTAAPVPAQDPAGAAPPRSKDADPRCDAQRLTDLQRCSALRETATNAELTRCYVSSGSRAVACSRGATAPPLQVPPGR